MAVTGVVTQAQDFAKHATPPGFPERPERLLALENSLLPLIDRNTIDKISARPATLEQLTDVHSPSMIDGIKTACEEGQTSLRQSSDLPLCEETFATARLASGSVLQAIDSVMSGELKNAFCAVRPPGHHAFADHAEGFCFVNNIAVGAQYLINTYGLERVAIVDWDLHHGNGTQDIFYRNEKVLFVSVHGDPSGIYPFRSGFEDELGDGAGKGFNLNVPLPYQSNDEALFAAWRGKVLPALEAFKPQFVLISAGFDAHRNDPFRHLRWSSDAYETLTGDLMKVAHDYCSDRLVSVLEGGYSVAVLQDVVPNHIEILAGRKTPAVFDPQISLR